MRIALLSAEYPPMQGGVGDCTHELGCALVGLGHEVVVVTSSKAGRTSQVRQRRSEPEVRPAVERWNWSSHGHVLRAAQDHRAEILHIQYQTAAYAMHPAVNLLPLRLRLDRRRPRVAVTFHDLRVPYLFPKAGPVRSWVTRALARWSDAAIATNVEDFQQLQSMRLPADPQLIPIGSNIAAEPPARYDRDAWRHLLGVNPGQTLLCYFGFLNESKGGETLFRCLGELRERGRDVKLLMIGGQVGDSDPTNAAYLEYVQALARGLELTDRVLWTGYMPAEEVAASFLASDICVLPYRDGISYRRGTLMAAIAHGRAIVSTEPRVANPGLVNGENVLLVPPDDPRATADAIEMLMNSRDMRERLARGALQLSQGFSWERIARETAELYSNLVKAQ